MEELKKDISLLEEAIKQQIRMEEWVRTQDLRKKPDPDEMYRHIRENWLAACCPLCVVYLTCDKCVLAREYTGCRENSEWVKMNNNSRTWKQWLHHSGELRSVMERIKEKLEKKLEKIT